MLPSCPFCERKSDYIHDVRTIVRFGSFYRTSDSRKIARFRCSLCQKTFSRATTDPCYRQKKRHKNSFVYSHIASGVTQRRIALLGHISRHTVARKVKFLGQMAKEKLEILNLLKPQATEVEFDDLETHEHTKCKPLSITLAVESKTRRILGFEVSSMPAKGLLVRKALKRYGPRPDLRAVGRNRLFDKLKLVVNERALIKSDSNPHYPMDLQKHFPACHHVTVLSRRSSSSGQGELKKVAYDPIFSLNHTCAMYRANVANLIRKTWATTKKSEWLAHRLAIYAQFHNTKLI